MEEVDLKVPSFVQSSYVRVSIIVCFATIFHFINWTLWLLLPLVLMNGYYSIDGTEAGRTGIAIWFFTALVIALIHTIRAGMLRTEMLSDLFIAVFPTVGLSMLGHSTLIRKALWLFFVVIFISGLPLWITNYHDFTNNPTILQISMVLLAVATAFITIASRLTIKETISLSFLAFFIAVLIKDNIDMNEDSTSHNLLPFELFFELLIASIPIFLGLAAGVGLRQIFPRKVSNNVDAKSKFSD